MKKDGNFGLSTYDALGILHDDIDNLLKEKISTPRSKWTDLKNLFCHGNEHSTISWLSASVLIAIGLILIVSSFLTESDVDWFIFAQGILIILICSGNVLLVLWDDFLRLTEIPSKVQNLLKFLKECQEKVVWEGENYPHLCSPYSPCITLQWTYRDQRLVNLPWSLLVRGDTVLLRPGQPAPAYSISPDTGCRLSCGEVYSPPQKHENISLPTARTPLPNKRYVLQETPLLRNIREVLEQSKRCPVTCYDKYRYLITVTVALHIILPVALTCNLLINIVWYLYAGEWNLSGHWLSVFILQPIAVVLPLLPLVLPIGWIFLNTLGYAKTSAFLQSSFISTSINVKSGDPFEEISIQEEGVEEVAVGLQWCQHLLHTLQGRQHFLTLTRTINPLHVFGSVTALCCVDKKGILSWPNPTAEKVFFLRSATIKPSAPSEIGRSQCDDDLLEEDEAVLGNDDKEEELSEVGGEIGTVSEVLDLTHDSLSPFKLYFDDTRWQEHMGSLKPLGLAILLNTCNPSTHDHYLQFCSHVTCEALYNEDLVPVTNRSSKGFKCLSCVSEVATLLSNNKCLCELSKQIGFTDDVIKNFKLLEQLSTFRHVQPETVRRDIRFARSLALATKLKLPFPHMVSVVTSEVAVPNSLQLFSQATGDIALDSCIDFWDGSTLRILTPSDRKKVLDFYQRTSLTAYCTAFGYRPLSKSVDHSLSSVYMELPADSQPLYIRNRSPTPIYPQHLTLSQSIDSLFGGGDVGEDVASDIDDCFEVQCNQIFLGMVTMQYQAQAEMVTLIEQLERACIRFVHFSKENELRSRVFSEKMGLESGWNCHISLLSSEPIVEQTFVNEEGDKDEDKINIDAPLLGQVKRGSLEGSKNISASAPCDLGLEQKSITNQRSSLEEDMESHGSIHDGWQSLSCLTDSTESAPINLIDLKNRAKLPRGIDHVRPHLEQVDNVPLLVSLFTDCTPATTRQMIGIMQDYGRVVTVIGSSANADNCGVFLKANASVSIEPLYPQVCQKVSVYRNTEECISPCHLGQRLNSLPCSVSISRQRPVSLFHLIMQCRHYMMCLWNALQFWICCCIVISTLQLLCTLLILPPLFSIGQVLWLCCIVVPFLAATLVFTPTSPKVMQRPGAKTHSQLDSQVIVFVVWCYGGKIFLSLLLVPLIYTLTLTANCPRFDPVLNITCHPFLPLSFHTSLPPEVFAVPLQSSQTLAFTLTVLHLVTMSISFVYRDKSSWHKSPFQNKVWLIFSAILITVHLLYFFGYLSSYPITVPWYCILIFILSPLPLLAFNELIKWHEIKVNVRYERRARLDFGTKLGMNSPF